MKCRFCGNEIEDGSLFCGYCGKEQPKVKYCIQCGHEIDADAEFCCYCGGKQTIADNIEESVAQVESISETKDSSQEDVPYPDVPVESEPQTYPVEEVDSISSEEDNNDMASSPNNSKKTTILSIVGIILLIGVGVLLFNKYSGNEVEANLVESEDVDTAAVEEEQPNEERLPKVAAVNIEIPTKPTGTLASGCPNEGASYIQTWGIIPSDQAIDIFTNSSIKYYVSGNSVQIWDGGFICAEYTATGSGEDIKVSSFKIYSKMISGLRSEKNRIYSTFEGKAHHESGPVDGYFYIDDGMIKHYALSGDVVYVNSSEYTKYNGTKTVKESKSFDTDGSIISHILTENNRKIEDGKERDIKTTYYDKNGGISYYTIEKTTGMRESGDMTVEEDIKITKYDKNNNVISVETKTETYGLE